MYASDEERWFSYYIDELIQRGYIFKAYYQPEPFRLSEPKTVQALSKTKKVKNVTINLLREHVYTADWRIDWNECAEGVFFWQEGKRYNGSFYPYSKSNHNDYIPFIVRNGSTYIDVKGGFVGKSNSSAITFPINQKIVYDKFDIIVQKVVVTLDLKGIFSRTFTPRLVMEESVYKTSKHGKYSAGDSKLKYEPITIDEYIKLKTK